MTSSVRLCVGAAALYLGGCGNATVSLGDSSPPLYRFTKPLPVPELGTTFANENPTLTGDLLELWFNSNRADTEGDVWVARRRTVDGPFAAPERVEALSSALHETSPAIAPDGLTVYFGSNRATGGEDIDIWTAARATRTSAWSTPTAMTSLNSPARDLPRPPGMGGLVMPLSSQRDDALNYQTFFSARAGAGALFGAPVAIPELTFANHTTVDAFLSDDGLTMFYSASPTGAKLDLFVSWRQTTGEPFSVTAPLSDLNSGADERDPWLSPDGTVFFFTSDRGDGVLQIYQAAASREPRAGR